MKSEIENESEGIIVAALQTPITKEAVYFKDSDKLGRFGEIKTEENRLEITAWDDVTCSDNQTLKAWLNKESIL